MLDKYCCDAYDSGYCYRLGRPLTDEEDDICEEYCNAISTMSTYEQLEYLRGLAELEETQAQIIKEEEYICNHVNEADDEFAKKS